MFRLQWLKEAIIFQRKRNHVHNPTRVQRQPASYLEDTSSKWSGKGLNLEHSHPNLMPSSLHHNSAKRVKLKICRDGQVSSRNNVTETVTAQKHI